LGGECQPWLRNTSSTYSESVGTASNRTTGKQYRTCTGQPAPTQCWWCQWTQRAATPPESRCVVTVRGLRCDGGSSNAEPAENASAEPAENLNETSETNKRLGKRRKDTQGAGIGVGSRGSAQRNNPTSRETLYHRRRPGGPSDSAAPPIVRRPLASSPLAPDYGDEL
jgi:hypothetical protein